MSEFKKKISNIILSDFLGVLQPSYIWTAQNIISGTIPNANIMMKVIGLMERDLWAPVFYKIFHLG